jgi:hypothetical protein
VNTTHSQKHPLALHKTFEKLVRKVEAIEIASFFSSFSFLHRCVVVTREPTRRVAVVVRQSAERRKNQTQKRCEKKKKSVWIRRRTDGRTFLQLGSSNLLTIELAKRPAYDPALVLPWIGHRVIVLFCCKEGRSIDWGWLIKLIKRGETKSKKKKENATRRSRATATPNWNWKDLVLFVILQYSLAPHPWIHRTTS